MKKIKTTFITALLILYAALAFGQERHTVGGKVLSGRNVPVEGAFVTVAGSGAEATTGSDGTFRLENLTGEETVTVWAPGYFPVTRKAGAQTEITVVMIPDDSYKKNQTLVMPFRIEHNTVPVTAVSNIAKEEFAPGSMLIDRGLSGQVAGLRMTRMSGMPGEGSYMNLRGIRSFIGENAPLVVINNVPYLPDSRESQLINGMTRNIFQTYNIQDIQNITVLKGAEASIYGSMGSNGVILIETDGAPADNLETRISFFGQYGINWSDKRMPLLKGLEYKSYLSDVGMNYFDNMESFFTNFPFLTDPNSKYNYLYNNETDWQEVIYRNSFVTDNLFRFEGGDAIAKYDLSLGYTREEGIMDNTNSQRYHTQLNTNVFISKSVEFFATVGLAYLNGNFQEQGMLRQTNPILAAYGQAPILNPYAKDYNGNTLSTYATYHYGISDNMDFATSNPLAILNTLDARNNQYDFNVRAGLNYSLSPDITLTGTVGLFYNYNGESLFVPGLTDKTILPFFDQYGESRNTVKKGVGETLNWYYNLNGQYRKSFDGGHKLGAMAGVQVLMSKKEYDAGVGRNTANDFYQTLGSTQGIGRYFYGYLEKWNWMNFYGRANYTYNDLFSVAANLAVDGASSGGTYGQLFHAYPSASAAWMGKGWLPLSNSTFVNRFNVRAEYGLTGNSRFSSNYGKYYYTSMPYQLISGVVRGNISNTHLKPERTAQLNVGLDLSLWYNRIDLSVDYYNSRSSDVIFAVPLSSGFGTGKYYDNIGEIENKGVELSVQASLVRTRDVEWIVGGNIASNKGKVTSLGGVDQLLRSFDDGAQLVTRVGDSPYQFYGYQAKEVFQTQAAAEAANLINDRGRKFQAGDIHYQDLNGDHRIDNKDRVALGDASPDYFGGFYTQVRYKGFSLAAEFVFSQGNMAYNAVRRELESLDTFGNQSLSALNRWSLEGQITDVPRAQWGDPLGNGDFSSRWIEDASYLKMRSLTLSYDFDRKVLNFIRSGTVFVTAENLFTVTKYLGMDPEFAYSYDDAIQGFDYAKLMIPKTIKFGINLKF